VKFMGIQVKSWWRRLEEEDVVGVAQTQEGLAAGDGLVDDAVELLAAVAALGDAEALALVVEKGGGGALEDGCRSIAGRR